MAGGVVGAAVALHAHRPHDHVAREAVGEPVQDVADDGAGRRGDDSDHPRQERQRPFAFPVEQPLARQLLPQLVEQRHQRADTRRLQRLDDDLVFRAAGIGGELAGRDDLQPILRAERQARCRAFPHHAIEQRILILEREIKMTRGGALHAR